MIAAGYSGKSLIEKLGYKPDESVMLIDAPPWFKQYLDSGGITASSKPSAEWCHAFFSSLSDLMAFAEALHLSGITKGLWVSWPKKSSELQTDLSEQSFRDVLLPHGWVDTKVCAIDETWSALKFLRRKA